MVMKVANIYKHEKQILVLKICKTGAKNSHQIQMFYLCLNARFRLGVVVQTTFHRFFVTHCKYYSFTLFEKESKHDTIYQSSTENFKCSYVQQMLSFFQHIAQFLQILLSSYKTLKKRRSFKWPLLFPQLQKEIGFKRNILLKQL